MFANVTQKKAILTVYPLNGSNVFVGKNCFCRRTEKTILQLSQNISVGLHVENVCDQIDGTLVLIKYNIILHLCFDAIQTMPTQYVRYRKRHLCYIELRNQNLRFIIWKK